MGRYAVAVTLLLLLQSSTAWAVTPIARFDVVPYQRIEYGSSFKVGVVAFSKPGIASVAFSVTDNAQGYSGGTKTATSMTYNDRSDTYEYWVTFSASEFTSNGAIEIAALVTDEEENTRNLTLAMIVEGESAFTPQTCYVATTGNDSTCTIDDSEAPCLTVTGCEAKLDDTGDDISGDIIYVQAGTYSTAGSATTSTEWLTISAAPGVENTDVILNAGRFTTTNLKYDGVTLQSTDSGDYRASDNMSRLWTNNCRRIGSGRWISNSNPVHFSDEDNHFSTNDYTYNADYGYRRAAMVRGADISTIGNDAFENTWFIVNATTSSQSNGSLGAWHADATQTFDNGATPISNMIIYGYRATDIHYEGGYLTSLAATAQDVAFVNMLIEMREPADDNELGNPVFASTFANNWNHVLMWNCTWLGGHINFSGTYTDSSFVGNIFWHVIDYDIDLGDENKIPSWAEYGNEYNSEYLYNHSMNVYQITSSEECTTNSRFIDSSWPCPHLRSMILDSSQNEDTHSLGEGVVDVNPSSETWTYPVSQDIIGQFPPRVPIDIYNNSRGSLSDLGAVQSTAGGGSTNGGMTFGSGVGNTTFTAGSGNTNW